MAWPLDRLLYGRSQSGYHPLIQERLTTYPELSAVRLLAECQAAGYPGVYSPGEGLRGPGAPTS
jgi:hypothetical protein